VTTIKSARIERGLKQCELAFKAGVNIQSLSRWENGWARPSAESAAKLASVLGVSPASLRNP
jgi:transcriptional regulator with XRE-family HTH domain